MSKVICNSSPIIGLCLLNKIELLWELFDEVIIPQEVYNEVVVTTQVRTGAKELEQAISDNKIKVLKVKNTELVNQLYGRLHHGELEVMVLAKELGIKHVIIDDRSARHFADTMMLKTVGLIGLLVLAKQKHKIEAVRPYMDILIRNDYRISVKLYNQILGMAKEI